MELLDLNKAAPFMMLQYREMLLRVVLFTDAGWWHSIICRSLFGSFCSGVVPSKRIQRYIIHKITELISHAQMFSLKHAVAVWLQNWTAMFPLPSTAWPACEPEQFVLSRQNLSSGLLTKLSDLIILMSSAIMAVCPVRIWYINEIPV